MFRLAPQVARRLARALLAPIVVALVTGSAPEIARAQGSDIGTVERELERTDQVLERASELVKRSGSPRAAKALEFAMELQKNAWSAFHDRQRDRAIGYTRRAREMAHQAIQLASQDTYNAERAQRVLEEAEHALERARGCVEDSPSDRALQALHLASDRLEQAREAFHEHKFQVTTDISLHVGRMLKELCNRRPVRQVERLIESVERLLESARTDLEHSDNEQVLALLARAEEHLVRAKEQLLAGRAEAATRHAHQAKELVLRAMRQTQTPPSGDRVDRALEETGAYVENLAQRVGEAGVHEAEVLMERALEHLQRARELRLEGKLRRALAEARVARNLARRAASMADIQEL